MKIPTERLCLGAGLLLLAAQALCQEATSTRYQVQYLGDDRFHVEARFAQPVTRLDLSDHGATGRPTGQSASVRELRAYDAKGKPIAIEFIGDGTWVMKQGTAGRVSYDLVADHDAVTWRAGKEEVASRFDDTFYFVGDAFFLVDYQGEKSPIELEFDLPAGWQVTSPWSGAGNRFFASNPDALGSNAFAMGRNLPSTVDIGGLRLTWLADSRVATASARMAPLFERLPATYTEFWGGTPGDRLNIFLLSDRMTDGGAFKNSFAMRLDTPLRESEAAIWSHTLAHELMHIWMNQSNDGIGRAPGGSHAWFTEGFTDYLTIKLMRQAGLIDQAMAAQRVANLIRRYRLGQRLSPGLGLFAAGERKHDNWELVYGGGAMVALLLDASLSNDSPLAFRDTLRRLQHLGGKPMDGAAMLAALDQGSAGRASEIFRALDAGLSLEALRQRLAASGIGVEGFATDEVYVALPACSKIMCPETAASAYADAMLLPLQLRTREAMASLQAIDAVALDPSMQATLACMRERFGSVSVAAAPSRRESAASKRADAVIQSYQRYWHGALLDGADPKALEAASTALLSDLRRVLGEAGDADWDRIDERVGREFDAAGWHVLRGITPPLRELIVWADEHIEDEQAALPDGPEAVRVVFMSDFKSRGWAHYATCGRSSAGGWTGTDRLHAVADAYDRSSEHYRVSYLAHEGQHFRDKRRFSGAQALPPWQLEYRAKLVELTLARERQADLLAVFAGNTSDDSALAHSHANQRVMMALDKSLPGHGPWRAAATWTEAEADALRRAARAILARDELELTAPATGPSGNTGHADRPSSLTQPVEVESEQGNVAVDDTSAAGNDEVDGFLLGKMKERHIPGLQVAVVRNGRVVKSASYGVANLQDSVAVDDDTLFAINSMTKAFTGVAVMQLVEQGKLRLTDRVSRFVPDLPADWAEVTIAQMVSHTSGLPNIMNNNTGRLVGGDSEEESWKWVQQQPMEFSPNEKFSYNQTNYLLLGKIIAKQSGKPFTDFIVENQLQAVGMRRTIEGGFAHYDEVVQHSARGYSTINSDKVIGVYESFPPSLRTAAGMSTTATELASWLIALQEGKLFSEPGSLQRLWTPAILNNGHTGGFGRIFDGYAMGWPTVGRALHPAIAAIGGGRSAMFVYPQDDLSIVVLTNLQGAFPERFMDELASFYIPGIQEANRPVVLPQARKDR